MEVAKNKLSELIRIQEYMKKINAAHKSYLKKGLPAIATLSESEQQTIIQYVPQYSWEKHPFAPYRLTNNNAMIRNTEDRVKELSVKEQKAESGNKIVTFEGGKVIFNYELDRLQIAHDEKPAQSVINDLKSHGFRWSPFYKVWQRQLTNNAIYITKNLLKLPI